MFDSSPIQRQPPNESVGAFLDHWQQELFGHHAASRAGAARSGWSVYCWPAGVHLELLQPDTRPAQGVLVQHCSMLWRLQSTVRNTTISVALPDLPAACSADISNWHCMYAAGLAALDAFKACLIHNQPTRPVQRAALALVLQHVQRHWCTASAMISRFPVDVTESLPPPRGAHHVPVCRCGS